MITVYLKWFWASRSQQWREGGGTRSCPVPSLSRNNWCGRPRTPVCHPDPRLKSVSGNTQQPRQTLRLGQLLCFFSPTLLHTGTAAHRKFPRAACFGPFPLATFSWGCWRSSKKWKSAPAHQQIRSHLRRDFFMRRSATRFWCHYNKQIFWPSLIPSFISKKKQICWSYGLINDEKTKATYSLPI